MSTYGVWLSAAGMKVNEHRQTLLANNMANAETAGFKHDWAIVTQRRIQSLENPMDSALRHPVLDGLSGGVHVRPPHSNFATGPIDTTGGRLHAAIAGDGFFAVTDGSTTRYTRDGNFTLSRSGELVMSAGNGRWKVLDDTGLPITLDDQAGEPEIFSDGSVRQGDSVMATLAVMIPDVQQAMRKVGENLFDAASTQVSPARAHLVGGALERSNFDVMMGLTEMLEASRAYEMNANMIRFQDEATGEAVSRVGRVA